MIQVFAHTLRTRPLTLILSREEGPLFIGHEARGEGFGTTCGRHGGRCLHDTQLLQSLVAEARVACDGANINGRDALCEIHYTNSCCPRQLLLKLF